MWVCVFCFDDTSGFLPGFFLFIFYWIEKQNSWMCIWILLVLMLWWVNYCTSAMWTKKTHSEIILKEKDEVQVVVFLVSFSPHISMVSMLPYCLSEGFRLHLVSMLPYCLSEGFRLHLVSMLPYCLSKDSSYTWRLWNWDHHLGS